MKRILLSLFAILTLGLSASAQSEATYTTSNATVAPADGWDGYTDPFATIQGVTVEVYGVDSVIIRNWAGVEGYDLFVQLNPSDTTVTNVYTIENGSPNPYVSGSYYYVSTGSVDTNYTIWGYAYLPYCYAGLSEGGKIGYVILMGYYSKSTTGSADIWGYYSITWDDEDDTTGISAPVVSFNKVNAPAYNLAGQKVGADYKGIVVQNGKKFIRK